MAAYAVLKEIVSHGCNLTICKPIAYSVLDELAALAKSTGARLTVTTSIAYPVIHDLSSKYGNTVAFIDGLDKFKKD